MVIIATRMNGMTINKARWSDETTSASLMTISKNTVDACVIKNEKLDTMIYAYVLRLVNTEPACSQDQSSKFKMPMSKSREKDITNDRFWDLYLSYHFLFFDKW